MLELGRLESGLVSLLGRSVWLVMVVLPRVAVAWHLVSVVMPEGVWIMGRFSLLRLGSLFRLRRMFGLLRRP